MTRLSFRPILLPLGILASCFAVAATARGQGGNIDLKPFMLETRQPNSDDTQRMNDLHDGKLRTVGPDAAKNKEVFKHFAQLLIYPVTQPQYYQTSDTGELKPRPASNNLDSVLSDIDHYLLVPDGTNRLTLDQADYVDGFGAALDQALVTVLTGKPGTPTIIRVNAGRFMAKVARSGAPAIAKTVLTILNNQFYKVGGKAVETPPDLLFYALKSAEGLLAAYDIRVPQAGLTAGKHSIPERDLISLVQVLELLVLKGPPVADKAAIINASTKPKPVAPAVQDPMGGAVPPVQPAPNADQPMGKLDAAPAPLTHDQEVVVTYYRRQAIRALAKVRFDVIGGQGGLPEVRPAWTLARIAVIDASLDFIPTTAEIGDAVIGLASLYPTGALNVDELLSVIARGTVLFVREKLAGIGDKTVPWKVYAARLNLALAGMRKLSLTNLQLRPQGGMVGGLAGVIIGDVLAPIERESVGARPSIDRLNNWIAQNTPKIQPAVCTTTTPSTN
ncbi:hypothetical protein [Fimbriiglobus ruber]|uniref:Uncharacterized protein n=1 Tax=Fimbriiglobus ruber TaxID=1908690 RepID=A0A225DLN1_9BACT|nr:hypothetical protein [Fimbriiglobus ruber]OWK39458.1 hypothetical protein FRUB_06021 [Fimbriiglobus ruber]